MNDTPPHRLPRTVLPQSYALEIEPDLAAGRFRGRVRIEATVRQATDRVTLNAVGLEIEEAVVAGRPATVRAVPDMEQVVLELPEPLLPGTATLECGFAGRLGEDMRGFYRSRFAGPDGAEHPFLATDFEATNARRAFPCFDEPDMKATFAVTLVVPDGLTALSCGPVEGEEPAGGGRRRVHFAPTIPVSTYVVAWVIAPLELTDPVEVDGVRVRVAAPLGRLPLSGYALGAAVHAMRYLAAYFGIPYPGAKLDHVAVPNFGSGAMENLGCVTYRESLLLADPERSSQAELREIALTVAHETSHMWFGDLATMRWWNGLWLNEAFATLMESKTVEDFNPAWDVWAAAGPLRADALVTDALSSTRPIEYPVERPEDAEGMFDVLTYQKGGAVLRMLEQYLGEETFRLGIGRYLQEHAYGNTETTDLWDAIEAESGQPVRATMDGWILQPGYPVVTARRGDDPAELRLAARRFSYRGEAPGRWRVPLLVRASVGGRVVERRILLDEARTERFDAPLDWVVVNGGGWGFYRVDADPDLRPAGEQFRACTPLERLTLLDDLWAAAVAGSAGVEPFVAAATDLGEETEPAVWATVARALLLLDRLTGGPDRDRLGAAVRAVTGAAWARLGWDGPAGEPVGPRQARARVVVLRGVAGDDAAVRAEAAARWAAHRSGGALPPDLLTAAVTVVAATGGDDAYDALWAAYLDAATPQDRERYLRALPRFPGAEQAARTLELALGPEVRTQDAPFVIYGVLAGRHGHDVGWPWFEDHAAECARLFTPTLLGRALEGAETLADPATVRRAHSWLAEHPLPTSPEWVARVEEQMDLTVALAERVGRGLGPLPGGT